MECVNLNQALHNLIFDRKEPGNGIVKMITGQDTVIRRWMSDIVTMKENPFAGNCKRRGDIQGEKILKAKFHYLSIFSKNNLPIQNEYFSSKIMHSLYNMHKIL